MVWPTVGPRTAENGGESTDAHVGGDGGGGGVVVATAAAWWS